MTITIDFEHIITHITNVNWIANGLAIGVALAIGVVWYHSSVFGTTWRRLANLELQDVSIKQRAKTAIIWQVPILFILSVDITAFLRLLQWNTGMQGFIFGYNFGMVAALFIAIHYLYDMRPSKLYFITAGYTIAALSAMGFVIGYLI
jgi:Protein of unknown function (DUF1761)